MINAALGLLQEIRRDLPARRKRIHLHHRSHLLQNSSFPNGTSSAESFTIRSVYTDSIHIPQQLHYNNQNDWRMQISGNGELNLVDEFFFLSSPFIPYPLLLQYLCELSLLETDPYLQYMPSRISAAAIALARHNLNLSIWSTKLEEVTGYSLDDLKEIIFHLSNTHMASVDLPQQAIQDKYKASKWVYIKWNRRRRSMGWAEVWWTFILSRYKEVSTMQPIQMNDGLYINAVMRMKDEIEKEAHNKHNNDNVRKITSTLHSL